MSDEVMDVQDFEVNESEIETDVENVEESEVEAGQESSEATESADQSVKTPESTNPQKFSGREISTAIKQAIEQNPEQAAMFKKLQDAYFRNQAFEKAFPSATEATNVKQLLNDIGGVEGIEQLQQNSQVYQQQDAFLKEGNPEVLESIFNDFPDGAAKLAPKYLDKLAQTNPQAYNTAVYPHAIGLLAYSDFPAYLSEISQETDPAKMQAGVVKLIQWYNQSLDAAKNIYSKVGAAPVQDAKLTEREQSIAAKETAMTTASFQKVISTNTQPNLESLISKYAKQYNLAESQTNIFKKHLITTIDNEQKEDKVYQKQYQIRVNSAGMTVEKLGKFVSDDLNRRLKDRTFDIVKEIYGAPKSGSVSKVTNTPKAGVAKTTSSGGPIRINAKPDGKDVNWDKPDAQLHFIASKAWMKSGPYAGKFVTWAK